MNVDIDMEQAEVVISRIAEIAEAFAGQANVGGMETAGGLISYLATHPRDIEPLLKHGVMELPMDWLMQGCLSWHGKDGKVIDPDYARRANTIHKLRKEVPR